MTMTEALEYDHISFEVFCLEIYRQAKNLSGKEITALFDKHNVFDFIEECGDTLHCLAPQNIIEDIDKFIENHPA